MDNMAVVCAWENQWSRDVQFPPFSLILPVLFLLREHRLPRCTLVVPSMTPKPLLMSFCNALIKLGGKGDKNVLMSPSKLGFLHDMVGLK